MIDVVKRLSLGVLLIAAASAVLLVADLDRRTGGKPAAVWVPRIAVIQHANTPPLTKASRASLKAWPPAATPTGRTSSSSASTRKGI